MWAGECVILTSEICSQLFPSFVDRDMTSRFMGTGIGHGASRQQFDDILNIIQSHNDDSGAIDEVEAEDRHSSANSSLSDSELAAQSSKIAADNDDSEDELAEHEVGEDENFDMDKWETDS